MAYRVGKVGRLEVLRERRDLPYRVKRSIGERKRISKGDVFVRHGSQTARADDVELATLEDERDWPLAAERAREGPSAGA